MAKKIFNFIQSKDFALILIIILIALMLMATFIPQKSRHSPADLKKWENKQPIFFKFADYTEINNFYNSIIFFVVLGLILINISLCTYKHFIRTFKVHRNWNELNKQRIVELVRKKDSISIKKSKLLIDDLLYVLRRRLYRTNRQGGLIVGRKNSWGNWGTVIFHISLVIIVSGALLARATRMEGYVKLTEGEVISETHNDYLRINEGPFFNENHQSFQLILDDFEYQFWPNGRNKKRQSTLSIVDKGQVIKSGLTRPNYPMIYKGYSILQTNNFGWSAVLVLVDKQGNENSGIVRINTKSSSKSKSFVDFTIPGTDFSAESILIRSPKTAKKDLWMEYEPQELGLKIKIKNKKSQDIVYNGDIFLRQEIKLEDNKLILKSFDPWTSFVISKDDGVQLIYFGFWSALFGLIVMYIVIPKKIYILLTKEEDKLIIRFSGKTKRYFNSFKRELSEIKDFIAKMGES